MPAMPPPAKLPVPPEIAATAKDQLPHSDEPASASSPPRSGDTPNLTSALSTLDQLVFPADEVPKPEAEAGADTKLTTSSETGEKVESDSISTPARSQGQTEPAIEEPKTNKQLRDAYSRVKSELHQVRTDLETARKVKPADPNELKLLHGELDTLRKRRDELEAEIRLVDYTKSKEYQERYEAPWRDALKTAYEEVAELVADSDGGPRKGTPDDFQALLRMSVTDATKYAQGLFGDSAATILMHRARVREAFRKAQSAAEEARGHADEHAKAVKAEQEERTSKLRQRYDETTAAARTKFPQWFAPDPKAPDESKLLSDGEKLADIAFLGSPDLTPDQIVVVQAEVRNRAAAFGRMVFRNRQLETRIQELENEVKQYKASEPERGREATPSALKPISWEEALDKL